MRKAIDSGCLCKDCKTIHLVCQGVVGASAVIDNIVERVESSAIMSTQTRYDLDMLTKTNDILSTPSKYDTVVKCLKPCLHTNKLKNAAHVCLDRGKCETCGFHQWWSKGLRPKLFKEDSTMDPSNPIFGDE